MKPAYMGPEKRRDKRLGLKKSFIVKVRVHPSDAAEDGAGYDMVSIKSLCVGGLTFVYSRDMATGTPLDFSIKFPMLDEPIQCKAEVIRTEKAPRPHLYHITVSFLEVSEDSPGVFKKAFGEFYSKKQGEDIGTG